MRALFFCGMLLFSTLVFADEIDRQTQAKRAAMFVEANQIDAARAIYQILLNSNPQEWEKSILYYNLGVLDTLQERWLSALQKFDVVDMAQDTPLWLLERMETNRMIALMGRMEEILFDVLPNSKQPNEVIDQLQQLNSRAKVAFNEIRAINCEEQACAFSRDVNALSTTLQVLEARIDAEYQTQRIVNLSTLDLIGTLQASLLSDRQQIEVLNDKDISAFLRMRVLERTPYWHSLTQQLGIEEPNQEAIEEATSRKAATVAIDQMLAILNSLFLKDFPKSEPAAHMIAKLRLEYAQAVGAELSLLGLQAIQRNYPQIIHEQPSAVAQRLLQARTMHEYGMQALLRDDPRTARIFFLLASSWVELARQVLSSESSIKPVTWLERLIVLQESINNATHEIQDLITTSPLPSKALILMLLRTQTAAVEMANPFLASVMHVQNSGYAANECQEVPWSASLPDFFEGYAQAAIANQELAITNPPWNLVRDSQQQAPSLWRQARHKLLYPENSKDSTTWENQQSSNETKELSLSDSIRYLQQMESEDRPEKPGEEVRVHHAW